MNTPRYALRLAASLIAMSGLACGGHDSADAGPPPLGDATISLEIQANPNNVLSAAAVVQWASTVTHIYITYQAGSGTAQQTPTVSTQGLTSPATLPVLLLQPDTAYTFQAIGLDASGAMHPSQSEQLTTGSLPTFSDGGTVFPSWTSTGTFAPAGYLMLASLVGPAPAAEQLPYYAEVVDPSGNVVWYYLTKPPLEGDFQQQPDGTFTLALLDATVAVPGLEESLTTYRQIDVLGNTLHTWQALNFTDTHGDGGPAVTVPATDDHDIRIQPNGDALLFGYTVRTEDATSIGGPSNASVVSDVLERITTSGSVTFAWNGFDYLSLADADPGCQPVAGNTVDLTHGNAIEVMDDGNYLINFRNLSQAVKIDSTTGQVLWTLGRKSAESYPGFTFVNDPFNGPSCEHAVRELQPESSGCTTTCASGSPPCANLCGNIIMFDNGDGYDPTESRAVEYALDTTAMTATRVWSTPPTSELYSFIHGYAQRLSNGDTLIDYGMQHTLQEVDPTGSNVVWQLTDFTSFDQTEIYGIYRAYWLGSLYSYDQ